MRMAGSPPIRFRLWNGELVEPEQQTARFTLSLADPKALYSLVANPNLAFGDLYSAGRLDVEGDLPDLMEVLYRSIHAARQKWPKWLDALWRNHNPRPTGISEPKKTSITITTWATPSTSSGWTRQKCNTPAPTTNPRTTRWSRPSWPNWSMCAANCA